NARDDADGPPGSFKLWALFNMYFNGCRRRYRSPLVCTGHCLPEPDQSVDNWLTLARDSSTYFLFRKQTCIVDRAEAYARDTATLLVAPDHDFNRPVRNRSRVVQGLKNFKAS